VTATAIPCRICGNADGNQLHQAREMMLGTREPFSYVECAGCGCVQIAEIPADLGRHYPTEYPPHSQSRNGPGPVTTFVRKLRASLLYGDTGRRSGLPIPGPSYHAWFRRTGVGLDSRILDVGSGSGRLLRKLRREGFRDLTGVDPYLSREVDLPGLRMRSCQVSEMDGSFDLVMLHHSLEHIPDQVGTLREVARLARPSGKVLVRIPVADSWAWRHYGIDWVQLDAPRHLYLHTRRSLATLAEKAGLRIAEVLHDSEEMQFLWSELYRRDIPMLDPATHLPPLPSTHFRRSEIRAFRSRSRELNLAGEGDQACFFLELA
jgi:SAM-dependent methyltransferase